MLCQYKPRQTFIVPAAIIRLLAAFRFESRHLASADVKQNRTIRLKEADMANTKSAKKAVRKIAARTEVNKARRSRMRTYIRRVEEATASGDKAAAQEALKVAQPEIMRAVTRGVLKKNTAARKISRLSSAIKKVGA